MSRASILAMGRAAALRGMTDACAIVRPGPTGTDPVTGEAVPTSTPVYTGVCRVQTRGDWSTARDIGERGLVLLQAELQLPIGAAPEVNDLVEVTAAGDARLLDRSFIVRGEFLKSEGTARRVTLEEVTG